MTALSLREAATMALEALELYSKPGRCDCCGNQGDCAPSCEARGIIEALREALALPDAEPVTRCGVMRAGCNYLAPCGSLCRRCGEVHTSPQPAPVERKPLTEAEYVKALGYLRDEMVCSAPSLRRIVRAIEAAHGIKGAA